jgi:bifunctional DNase/RNase
LEAEVTVQTESEEAVEAPEAPEEPETQGAAGGQDGVVVASLDPDTPAEHPSAAAGDDTTEGREAVAGDHLGTEAVGTEAVGTVAAGADDLAGESVGTEAVGGDQIDTEPFDFDNIPEGASPLEFVDVVVALPSSFPVVILREVGYPERELHIPVGMPEGVAIAYAARHMPTPKPLTHELFVEALTASGVTIDVVRITGVSGKAYFAELVITGSFGNRVLSCRPSDGICLALRSLLPVPITATAKVLDEVGIQPA